MFFDIRNVMLSLKKSLKKNAKILQPNQPNKSVRIKKRKNVDKILSMFAKNRNMVTHPNLATNIQLLNLLIAQPQNLPMVLPQNLSMG